MDLKTIRYEVDDDGVALVTLNRPDRMNAWTIRMQADYHSVLAEADRDPAVRAVVVTGAGRGFCAGADMQALDKIIEAGDYNAGLGTPPPPPPPPAGGPDVDHVFTRALGLAKPVIAAVNGPAAGVGFVLMACCDIRFAAAGAKLTTSFARLGLPAEHGVSWVLSRLVGAGRAAELLLSARVILAEEAMAMGLVNRVFPSESLLDETLAYARTMARELAPAALQAIKQQLLADTFRPLHESAAESEVLMERMVTEPAFAEGVAAFQEKRPARFDGVSAS